ncbi:MAG: Ig-like domain-containing domain [Bacteroidetes bacterium]|nr:Ig-like domain-containing domain [Bacteroidota bacterium]
MIKTLRYIFFVALCAVPLLFSLFNCARESRPTGGLKDTTAPFVVRERPHNGATNQQQLRKIRVDFNEFITLKNPTETCIISPPLGKTPKMTTRRKNLTINLKGIELQDSTTYSFTFTNGIADVNEGNILNQYTYAFSTGNTIDTLQISGRVMNAETAEVSKTAFVLLYNNSLHDSAVMTKKPNYVTQVRNDGTFTLKNIAAGEYRIYALEEQNRDFMFNSPDEKIAFHEEIISPRAERFIDTTWFFRAGDTLRNAVRIKDSLAIAEKDSFSIAEKTRFLPEKLELTVFTNQAQTIDVISNKRLNRFAWGMRFSTAVTADDYTVQIPNFAKNAFSIDQVSADSVLLWLRDTALIAATDAKIIVKRLPQKLDTVPSVDTFALATISAIPERLQAVSIPEKPLVFSGDSLHIQISRPIATLNSGEIQLYMLRDSFALWSSRGEVLVKNAEGKYDVECTQRIVPEFRPKLFYEKQKILSQRLGTNRCALYFAKNFNPSDIQITLKAYPNLQNWYVSQYDAETNALLLWFTSDEVRVLKNPILEVSFPENGLHGALKKEIISFSTILTEKDRIKSPKNGRLLLAIEKSQEKSFFIDNAIEIVCKNPITHIQDSLIRMVDLRDTSKISVVTRCEVSKTEPRKLLIFHNAQPAKNYLITLEKNALTDIFGNTSRQSEFSINAQGETTAPYFYKEEFAIVRNEDALRNFSATAKWKEGSKYSLNLSPRAVLDIYGDHCDTTQIALSSPLLENYGELVVQLTNVENIVLELLPAKAKIAEVKYIAYEAKENTIIFSKIEPGSYNLRAFIDVNNNKRWDTGSLQLRRKAEKRLLYETPIEIKAGRQTNVKWENK